MKLDRDRFLDKYGHSINDLDENGLVWAKLVDIYDAHHDRSVELKHSLDRLEFELRDVKPPPHAVRGRVKDPEHVIDKIIRKAIDQKEKYQNIDVSTYDHIMTDLVGARILHLRKRDWFPIDRFLRHEKDVFSHEGSPPTAYVRKGDPDLIVQDYKRWGLELDYHSRGYRSVHYVIPLELDTSPNIWAEIQVRTLIEEAWSEIDHALSYPRATYSKAAAQYLLMFNRIAGTADEMGAFVSRYWDHLDAASKIPGPSGTVLDAADEARLARILKCSAAKVTRDLKKAKVTRDLKFASRETDSTNKEGREANNKHENPIVAGTFGDRLGEYYGAQSGQVQQYRIECGERDVATPMYTTESRIGMCLEENQIEITLDRKAKTWRCPVQLCNLGLKVCCDMIEKDVLFWNDPIYSVRSATFEGDLTLTLSIDEYFSYRFTYGLLEDELMRSDPENKEFTLRDQLLPEGTLENFGKRVCPVGVTALCAFADEGDDFRVLLHDRSEYVADGRGLFAVVPKAIHQPGVGNHEPEQKPYWTLLREIFEEIFSGSSAERFPEIDDHKWFFKECKPVEFIHQSQHGSRVRATGLAIDSLKGSLHVSYLVVVEDKEYWRKYCSKKLSEMWEQKNKFVWLRTRDSGRIAQLVSEKSWASDCLFSFVEGLLALKEFFPDKVCLPSNFRRYLGQEH